jgi:cyclic pyranopterin phosphate synthase
MELSHIDESGSARMVDVSGKPPVRRTATAAATICMAPETIAKVRDGLIKKGDVLAVARVAGINAAKKTADLIPLCHALRIDCVSIEFTVLDECIEIKANAVCTDRTGIEMEVLTAASVAALTIYDMCKAVDKNMRISDLHLLEKTKAESQ